jgi:hypothetical protein
MNNQIATIINNNNNHESVSSKYSHVQTSDIIARLESKGLTVHSAGAAKSKKEGGEGFQRHMVRMRSPLLTLSNVGDSIPEVLIINSHDGLSSLKIRIGIFRLVCSNGMVVGTDLFEKNIRHVGNVLPKIDAALEEVFTVMPVVAEKVLEMQNRELTQEQQIAFAAQAAQLVVPENAKSIALSSVLTPRRSGDIGNSAWLSYNRAQEACIRGGVRYVTEDTKGKEVFRSTRRISAIKRQVEVNSALWDLATAA